MVLYWRTSCPDRYDLLGWVFHFVNLYSDSHDQANTRTRVTYTISDTHSSANTYARPDFDHYSHPISDTYAHAYS